MADVHSPIVRSYNMSKIKATDTKPEVIVRKYLFANGFRYKKNDKSLPGKPDVVLPKYKTAIFVNGCFWHGHDGCKYYVTPKTNTEFWVDKIIKNKERDAKNISMLAAAGWSTITVWECQLKKEYREHTLEYVKESILQNIHT